jgi:2-dehydro-3-deoxyphosphogluconate aldolase / (4S)-4-hydroxy-2-oxoglutarate aldolase
MNSSDRQQQTHQLLRHAGVLPVVTVANIAEAIHIANALQRGGLTAIEVTLRSAIAIEAISAIKKACPTLLVGAGTVLTAEHAHQSRDAGADFIVTPGTPPALAATLAAMDLPVIPGAATPSEIIALMALGFDAVKLFPAASVGGVAMAKSLGGPFPNLKLCPTGGISEGDAANYLALPNVLCIGGSWMVQPDWIANGQFDLVESSAARCGAMIQAARGKK